MVVFIALCVRIHGQLKAFRRLLPPPPDWTADVSVDRYGPMLRLLDDEDIRFLRLQPGSTPAMVKRFRRQRHQLFRSYLRSLQVDFRHAYEALVLVMVHSQADRRDIVRALMVSRAKFTIGVWRIRGRLLLYRWNLGHEPVARLVSLFEGLQLELLALSPAPDRAGA
jgi:hypothetical protein